MEEAAARYVQRILRLVDGEPVAMQEATAGRLADLLSEISEQHWFMRPSPDHWSAAEILAHLADSELVTAFRVRKIVSEPGCSIAAYAQEAWSRALANAKRPPQHSLRLFTMLREENLRLYRTLRPEQWHSFGLHNERGRETVEQLVRLIAGHDRNHLLQIERALGRTHKEK